MKIVRTVMIGACLLVLAGCGQKSTETPKTDKSVDADGRLTESGPASGLSVVTTLFPLYDFTRQVGGDKVHVKLILPPGIEPHNYDPSPRDIVTIGKSSVFIYTGEAMEPWARNIQRSLDKSVLVVNTSTGISMMESTQEEASDHGHSDGHGHEATHQCAVCGGSDKDPHIWLDLGHAQRMVDQIANGLSTKDPANNAYYQQNAEAYKAKLKALDEAFRTALDKCKHKTIYSGGHFAFSYFVKRYGLKHESPYKGFSPDAEPSPKAIGTLIEQVKKNQIKAIFHEEMLKPNVAEVISEETGAKLLLLHGAHNVSKDELANGATFISIMEGNLKRLKQGLEYSE